MKARALPLAVALALLASACVAVREVPPPETGVGIDVRSGDHVVAVPVLPQLRIGKLLVFFPGTGARPDQYTDFLARAALHGYHAVGLDYENSRAINFEVCPGQPEQCYEDARLEILTGQESPYVEPDVDVTNSAFNRLARLLEHEAAQHPEEGWDAFLVSGEPRWDRITVGGHSQGGGHAAMTAKLHTVDRVLLFGGTEPRAWTLEPFATPADRFVGLVHQQEPIRPGIVLSWENLGVPGQPTEIAIEAPANGSHRLVTTVTDCGGDPASNAYFHNCYIVDGWMPPPASDGTPAFAAVWDYMLTT